MQNLNISGPLVLALPVSVQVNKFSRGINLYSKASCCSSLNFVVRSFSDISNEVRLVFVQCTKLVLYENVSHVVLDTSKVKARLKAIKTVSMPWSAYWNALK